MKSAFITGAATGIGESLVSMLLQKGWQVFAAYRVTSPQQTAWFQHPNVIPVLCDVARKDSLTKAVHYIETHTDSLDLLVNNAAYAGSAGVIEAADMADYRKTMEVNFWGPIQLVQACVHLIKTARGRIVNTGSASVYLTIPMGSAYPVSKLALTSMTLHLRMELAPFGIEVTTLHPGGVETPMTALGEDVAAKQWQSIPEHLRSAYAEHFCDGATAVGKNFKLYSPDKFAVEVYRRVICAKRLKPSYLIGPGVAPLPWLHRLLPEQWVQNIWAKMFSAKP